jgi:hypothetical protein
VLPAYFLRNEAVVFSCMNGFRECITKARGYTPHGSVSSANMERVSPYFIDLYLSENGPPVGPNSAVPTKVPGVSAKKASFVL